MCMATQIEKIKPIIDKIFGLPEKASREFLYFCPICKHRKRKLSISFEKGYFKCWVCDNFSGKDLGFLIRRFGNHEDVQNYSIISESISIDLFNKLFSSKEEQKRITKNTCNIPDEYCFLFKNNSSFAKRAYKYLTETRKISIEDIYKWKIGICESGDYKNRIIIPSFNENGVLNFFIAQTIDESSKYKWLYPDVLKSNIVFNELNINWNEPLYITEGVFDAIKISNNVCALMGKSIAIDDFGYSKLIEKLILYGTDVYLCLDTDHEKGKYINRSIKIAEQLMSYSIHNIFIVDPYPYKDFGAIPASEIGNYLTHKEKIESSFDLLKKRLEMELIEDETV